MELKDAVIKNCAFRLNNAIYKRVELLENDDELNVVMKDEYEISDVDEQSFQILVRRRIYCDPEEAFDISVEYEVAREIAPESDFKLASINLQEEIDKDINFFIDDTMNKASALITSISSSFSMNPLITPPIFINDNIKK